MKEINLPAILDMFKTSSTVNEFILRCAVLGIDPEAMMRTLNDVTISAWKGQWLNDQQNRKVSLNEFFEMKKELGDQPEGSWMSDLCKQMCYLVFCG